MVQRQSPTRRGAVASRHRLRVGAALVILALECLALTGLSSWFFPDVWAVSRAIIDIDQSAGSDRGVNLTEVASHPSVMWDRTVTISARVQDIHGPRLMTIGNDAFFVGDSVLIAAPIGASLWPETLDENTTVRVTGIVRKATPATWSELSIETSVIPSDYEGEAVLVAEAVELNPPSEIGPGDKEFMSGSDGYDIGVTTYDLVHGGDAYLGRSVVVSGEVEDQFVTPHAFLLGDDSLLVISAEPRPELFIEATAYVRGQVLRFHIEEMEADLGIDLDDDRFSNFGGVVLVAEAVEVVA